MLTKFLKIKKELGTGDAPAAKASARKVIRRRRSAPESATPVADEKAEKKIENVEAKSELKVSAEKAEPSADSKVVSSKVKVGDSTREAKPNPVVDSAPDEDVKVDAKQDENKVSPVKKTNAESASVVKKASAEGASIVKKLAPKVRVLSSASATIVRKADRSAPASGSKKEGRSLSVTVSRGDTGRPSRPDNRGPRSDSRGPRSDGRGPNRW